MKIHAIFLLIIFLFLDSCITKNHAGNNATSTFTDGFSMDTLSLFDSLRNCKIPIAIYKPLQNHKKESQKIIIFSHGYGQNKGGDMAYSYLTNNLALKGYFVVSIQHELPTESIASYKNSQSLFITFQ